MLEKLRFDRRGTLLWVVLLLTASCESRRDWTPVLEVWNDSGSLVERLVSFHELALTEKEEDEFYGRWALAPDDISVGVSLGRGKLVVKVTNRRDMAGLIDLRFGVTCNSGRTVLVSAPKLGVPMPRAMGEAWIQVQNVAASPARRFADIAAMDMIGPGETLEQVVPIHCDIIGDGRACRIILVVATLSPRERRRIDRGGAWRPTGSEVVASWSVRNPDDFEPLSSCWVWVPSYGPSGKTYKDTFVTVECRSGEVEIAPNHHDHPDRGFR